MLAATIVRGAQDAGVQSVFRSIGDDAPSGLAAMRRCCAARRSRCSARRCRARRRGDAAAPPRECCRARPVPAAAPARAVRHASRRSPAAAVAGDGAAARATVRLNREPAALTALATGRGRSGARARGRARARRMAGQARRGRAASRRSRRRSSSDSTPGRRSTEHLPGLPPARRPRPGEARREPRRLGARARARRTIPARILLNGKEGPIGLMPPVGQVLSDDQIAAVLTYIRREWGQAGTRRRSRSRQGHARAGRRPDEAVDERGIIGADQVEFESAAMTNPQMAGGPAPHLDVGTRLGAYEIVARIGAGGMGEVYLAHDTRLGRRVALKVVPASLAGDGDRRRRLEREAQAAARLNHPNIVTLFALEETGGLTFLTMEYVEGQPLASHIPRTGMPLDRLLPVSIAIADAVAAAHRAGVVHRDLKPANVMLTAADARAKVLDFGLARLHANVMDGAAATGTAPITDVGHIVGTVAYMSPEQAEGRETDARSDIFSLGVMLFEMATGGRPFTGDTSISVITSILRDTPPAVSDLKPGLPVEFARIVRRCLQKEPDRRYQTAVDLRNALEEVKQESDAGISASAVAPLARPDTRHRWMAMTAAAAAVMLAALAMWMGKARSSGDLPAPKMEIRERQVTSNPIGSPVFFAAISPDGGYVAYSDTHGLNIRFIDTGETRTVPVPPEFCFT